MGDTTAISANQRLNEEAVRRVLDAAASLDRDFADSLTVCELREIAAAAGLSSGAVETALLGEVGHGVAVRDESPDKGPPRAITMAYGFVGALLGAAVSEIATMIDLALFLIAMVSLHMLVSHTPARRLAHLFRDLAVFWTSYAIGWTVAGGDAWPHLFALPPLALGLTSAIGVVLTRLRARSSEREHLGRDDLLVAAE